MHARRSQARALFLTYVCCAFVAVLFAAPVLQSMASSSAGASRGIRPVVPAANSAAGASVQKKTSKEKDR
jgi:hypothetical protein